VSGGIRTGVIVQMRLDSTRLPGKALLPLGGTTLAGMVMQRLRGIEADEYILATDADGARVLSDTAGESGFSVFAGPKDDVLARYVMALEHFCLGRVIRATGDNPFVSTILAALAISAADEAHADYAGLVGMPTGFGVEVVAASALRQAAREATSPFDREHVCPYLYGNPHRFTVVRPDCPPGYRMADGRITVDTEADFRRAEALVAALGSEPDDADIMDWLAGQRKGD